MDTPLFTSDVGLGSRRIATREGKKKGTRRLIVSFAKDGELVRHDFGLVVVRYESIIFVCLLYKDLFPLSIREKLSGASRRLASIILLRIRGENIFTPWHLLSSSIFNYAWRGRSPLNSLLIFSSINIESSWIR